MSQPSTLRWRNRSVILGFLLEAERTRSQLAVITGLSKVTVTSIVNDLVLEGIVDELGRSGGQQGRPAGLVGLARRLGTAIGVDVQPQRLTMLASGLREGPTDRRTVDLDGPTNVTKELMSALEAVRLEAPHGPLHFVTLAVPAPVTSNCLAEPNAVPALDDAAIRHWGEATGVEVRFENDANLAAIAEHHDGAAHGADPFAVLLERETGLGVGLFLCGKLYSGQHGRSGELGDVRWPRGNTDVLLETLPPTERHAALAYVLSALGAALDLNLLVVSTRNEDLTPRLRRLLPQTVRVDTAVHGDDGPVRGALLLSVQRARAALLQREGAVKA
ncbi:ROK family transcriptional regulator [Deinococcus yavapaiensis]|uniref:ROK family protein n=1 Tax=Deinococcus yavapaiensis KR-236 TaxID=694435 RepID=A0A318S0A4_9DEIO|nr:ROK family transcriptional regulator [Deinococcus yavapaiensis]PYE50425.1 ROK family protein [Deinococcus yavapaiensis KR-236]